MAMQMSVMVPTKIGELIGDNALKDLWSTMSSSFGQWTGHMDWLVKVSRAENFFLNTLD